MSQIFILSYVEFHPTDAFPQTHCYSRLYRCMMSSRIFQSLRLPYFQASRLSMNIRAITVDRGIAMLAHQSRLSILFSFSSRGSRNHRNTGVGEIGTSSVDVISSPTGIAARQEEEELEGGYYDDDEDRDDEEIIQEDRSGMTRGEDVC